MPCEAGVGEGIARRWPWAVVRRAEWAQPASESASRGLVWWVPVPVWPPRASQMQSPAPMAVPSPQTNDGLGACGNCPRGLCGPQSCRRYRMDGVSNTWRGSHLKRLGSRGPSGLRRRRGAWLAGALGGSRGARLLMLSRL